MATKQKQGVESVLLAQRPRSLAHLTTEQRSAVWHALAKTAAGEADRAALTAGAGYTVSVQLRAQVHTRGAGGEAIAPAAGEVSLFADVTVGFDSTRASSSGPRADELLAVVLAKLNTATRERILRDLPDEFAANGNELPAVAPALIEQCGAMLKRLRGKVSQTVRGAVSVRAQIEY